MNYSIIREIENEQLKPEVTEFNVGDTVSLR
jgi:ribosomal protein L19